MVHSAVGWAVTLVWRIRRDPISMATKTYSTRIDAVTEAMKSRATMPLAWFLTKTVGRPAHQMTRLPGLSQTAGEEFVICGGLRIAGQY